MEPPGATSGAPAGHLTTSKPDCHTLAHASPDRHADARAEPERHANINTDAHAGAHVEPDGDAVTDANANALSVVHDNSGLETTSFSAWRTPTPLLVDGTLYLHNNPTPPMGDTTSQLELPMDAALPDAPVLYNYDVDRDGSPGLLIARGGGGPDEGDPTKYQAWRAPAFTAATVVDGTATVKLWTGTAGFDVALGGVVSVYLRDCDGSNCVELGGGTLSDSSWRHGSQAWVLKTLMFPVGPHTVAAGNSLELVVVVEPSSSGDMWFAYDTNDHKSRVTVPVSPATPLGSWAVLSGLVNGWLAQSGTALLFA